MPKFLMCSPQFFDIEYEINPWMDEENQVDPKLALKQWENLKETYLSLGCEVLELEPQKGWPDLVFTANAGLVTSENKVILSHFKYPDRQGEAKFDQDWFLKHSFKVIQPEVPFEGQGEAFIWREKILAGFGFRSTKNTASELEKISGMEVLPLQLINPSFYHLDMALAPINSNLIAYNPDAFSEASLGKIKSLECELIKINKYDAEIFGANLVPIDKTIVMIKGTTHLAKEFSKKGFKVIELDMSEFRKSGGGVRCLTLDLNLN